MAARWISCGGAIALLLVGCSDAADVPEPDAPPAAETGSSSGADVGPSTTETGSTTGETTSGDGSTGATQEETEGGSTGEETGEVQPRCAGITEYAVTWETGFGTDGVYAGGIAVAADGDGTLWVEQRDDLDVQSVVRLDPSGEPADSWDLAQPVMIASIHFRGLFFSDDGRTAAIGLDAGGLWTAGLDLDSDTVSWSDSLPFPEWDAIPVDATFGPDGAFYVTSQIEQLGPLVRDIVLAKYSPEGQRQWDVIVPNDALGDPNSMSTAVHARDDGEVIVVNRMAVIFHRYDEDGNALGTVNDVLYGIGGIPRFSDLDAQGRLVVGVAERVDVGQDVAQIRRFDENLEAEFEVQFPGTGYENRLMMGVDADDAVVYVHTFEDEPVLYRVVDDEIVLTQPLPPLGRVLSMTMVGDCGFVITGNSENGNGDWQRWRRRYDPV